MTLFNTEMKMADVILRNYLLIPVVNRFGIHLGFGEKTVKTLCLEHEIDADFFITMLNTFSNEHYFPEKKLQSFNALAIINYLKRTHRYYLETQIPLIERHINALMDSCVDEPNNLALVRKFFKNYENELRSHINREETITFPYISSIYQLYTGTFDAQVYSALTASYSMDIFDKQHDDIDDRLYDLKNIMIKYVSGNYDEALCNTVISELFRLEKDIHDHTRIEDKVLMPLVTEIEQVLLKNIA